MSTRDSVAFVTSLRESSAADREAMLLDRVKAMVASILEEDAPATITGDLRIFDLRLGSMVIVQLKHRLEAMLDTELPVSLFFAHATLEELTRFVLAGFVGGGEASRGSHEDASAWSGSEVEIEQISEAEAEERLRREMAEIEGLLGDE